MKKLILLVVFFALVGIVRADRQFAVYLERTGPQKESTTPFEITDHGNGEIKKGFHDQVPLFTKLDIKNISVGSREINTKPALGVNIWFQEAALNKLKDLEDNQNLVIYFDGGYKAIVPKSVVLKGIQRSSPLFIVVPYKDKADMDLSKVRLKELVPD